MIRLILLVLAIFLIWVAWTSLKSTVSKIKTRLSEGDQIPEYVDGAAITKLLEAATWVRGRQGVSPIGTNIEQRQGAVIACKNAIYAATIDPPENKTRKLIVTARPETSKGSDPEPFFLNEIIPLFEAARIRKYILAQVCDISDDFRADESDMDIALMFAYGAISIITFVIGYTVIPAVISAIFDEIDPESVRSLWNVAAFVLIICFGFAIPEYFTGTRILSLYHEIPLPKYMDKMELMGLLQDKIRSKTIRSLYYDEHGEVSIKGGFGIYSY